MWNPCDYKNNEGREKLWKQQEFKEIAWIMAITKLRGDLVLMEHSSSYADLEIARVAMTNDHPMQMQQTLNQNSALLTNL